MGGDPNKRLGSKNAAQNENPTNGVCPAETCSQMPVLQGLEQLTTPAARTASLIDEVFHRLLHEGRHFDRALVEVLRGPRAMPPGTVALYAIALNITYQCLIRSSSPF